MSVSNFFRVFTHLEIREKAGEAIFDEKVREKSGKFRKNFLSQGK